MKIKNIKSIVYSILAVLVVVASSMLTACSESDLLSQATLSDEAKDSKLITFEAGNAANQVSRASTGYRDWDVEKDPSTMGVFGWHDLNASSTSTSENMMFYNKENRYNYTANGDKEAWTEGNRTKWTYVSPKYWADYTYWSSFDFFATMPFNANAVMDNTLGSNKYKLSVPVVLKETIDEEEISSPITTSETAYISQPKHLSAPGYETDKTTIPFQFDQTLAGMKLEFQLGTKMGEIRRFNIKSVEINAGAIGLPYKGIATRTYTWSGSEWNAGDIEWVIGSGDKFTSEESKLVHYEVPKAPSNLIVTTTAATWGDKFFFIPATEVFTPTISVTYDVEVLDKNGGSKWYITRQNVTSDIVVNSKNFPNYNATNVKAGNIITLHINIVPDYLYVLSDFDHTTGVLVVDTTPEP